MLEPRKRKRTERYNRESGADSESDVDGDEQGRFNRGPKDVGFRPPKGFIPGNSAWTIADRGRIERGLMLYGFAGWEKKQEQVPRKTINEIKAAEVRLVYFVDSIRFNVIRFNGALKRSRRNPPKSILSA